MNVTKEQNSIKRDQVWWSYKENIKERNPNLAEIPDHPYRIYITRISGSWKTNLLFNLISYQPEIDENLFICWRFLWSKISIFN